MSVCIDEHTRPHTHTPWCLSHNPRGNTHTLTYSQNHDSYRRHTIIQTAWNKCLCVCSSPVNGQSKLFLTIDLFAEVCFMVVHSLLSCRAPGEFCCRGHRSWFFHTVRLSSVTNVTMKTVVFNPYRLRPASSVCVHRNSRLSAAALGEPRGQRPAKVPSLGWLTAGIYSTKIFFMSAPAQE